MIILVGTTKPSGRLSVGCSLEEAFVDPRKAFKTANRIRIAHLKRRCPVSQLEQDPIEADTQEAGQGECLVERGQQ
jgi:hypothetical protein